MTNNPDSTLAVTIIRASSKLKETDPHTLDLLANHTDPDHLEGLFNRDYSVNSQSPTVSFTYEGYQVTIKSSTKMTIKP